MAVFEVWAPGRQKVELVLEDGKRRLAMESSGCGRWRVEVGGLGAGTRYGFSLDGGPVRPDPRSRWQPEGIYGPSALVESDFAWSDQAWRGFDISSAVVYELHVGTFSEQGTLDGVISHLDHLVALGVNALELMPVAEASGERGWGYDGADLWAPHHAYGGPEGLKRLVDACHARGLAVVLDVVYNHLGPTGNYLAEFGPYFTDRYRTPWGSAVNFDGPGAYGVRDFVVSNALMWLSEYHVDGLRLDAVHAVHDESALHIVEELCAAVGDLAAQEGRKLWVVAESDRNDPQTVRGRDRHGWGATACWDDDFHHALHAVLTGERSGYYADFGRVADLAKAMQDAYVYDGRFSKFRQRRHGRPAGDLPGSSFVVFLQNHDQVGNRPLGDRISSQVGTDLLKVGAAMVVLSPYVPMLFQGEEWGASSPFLYFTDHRDPELARAVSEGRRREHSVGLGAEVPDPQSESSFLRSKLDWSELALEPHRSLLEWYRRLIGLRRSEPELCRPERGAVSTELDEAQRWLVLRRGRFSVAANFAGEACAVPLRSWGAIVLASEPSARLEGSTACLPPRSVAVVAH